MLKSKKVGIYVVKEITIGAFLPITKLIGENAHEGQRALMRLSVTLNNEPLGDALDNLGASMFMPLWNAVSEIHGMSEPEGDLGND